MRFTRKSNRGIADLKVLLKNCSAETRYAESFRTLRTNLFFSGMEKELNALVVTSSIEGEGKTTVAANLAHSMAKTERRVLLVDMDLRRPHLTSLFDMRGRPGVTDLVVEVFGKRLNDGELSDISVSDLVRLTRVQNRCCRLDLVNEQTQVSVIFEKGEMKDIHWKNRPEDKRLAATLVRRGVITEKEAHLALGHHKKSAQRLGSILYSMGLASRADLTKTLSVHIMEGARAMSAMDHGRYTFTTLTPGDTTHAIRGSVDLEPIYQEFSLSSDSGDYLHRVVDRMIQDTHLPNLKFLPAGAVPPNPAELAGSGRTRFLLDHLKSRFDMVIIDTPPVIPASDALLIAPNADGTVLVIRAGHTDRVVVGRTVDQFENAGLGILGTVLNRVNMKMGYYRHYQNYSAGYGD